VHHDVAWLDVAVNQADAMRFHEGRSRLPHQVSDPALVLSAGPRDEIGQRQPIDVLHRVVEEPLRGMAVVENRDGVGVREASRELHLLLEPPQIVGARLVGRQKLHRRRPS